MTLSDYASAVRLHEMSVLDRAIHCLFWLRSEQNNDKATTREIADLITEVGLSEPNVTRLNQMLQSSRRVTRVSRQRKWRLHPATLEELKSAVGYLFAPSSPAPAAAAIPSNVPFFVQADVALAKKMSDIYILIHCLENSARNLIRARLESAHGDDWWTQVRTTDMERKINDRMAEETRNRWHQPRGRHPLNYLNFGDLKNLICNNWLYFRDIFPDQTWVEARLRELEKSRNVIAHNNVLEDTEISRIQLYFGDWCRQIGGVV